MTRSSLPVAAARLPPPALTWLTVACLAGCGAIAGAPGVALPAPAATGATATTTPARAVFAGGCFWGVEAVFEHTRGVLGATSGYAGGLASQAHYDTVSTGRTGHAEAVEVIYDPSKVTYNQLLQVFFSVAHDPTELNRQGPDTGTQYRSEIFTTNAAQASAAKAYIAQLTHSGAFAGSLKTLVEPLKRFYPAENYHQDYLQHHPHQPYIVLNDIPKLDAFERLLPDLYRQAP